MNKPEINHRFQRGLSIPAVLSIMAVVTILALTFMYVVRYQIQRTGFEQNTITAGYVAEIGFQQVRAQLASVGGEWSELTLKDASNTPRKVVKDCATTDPHYTRCQRIPEDNSIAKFIPVYENPLDPTSRQVGAYEVALETGQKRTIFGNKTLTGASLGFVPGSANGTEQLGYDKYGNQLCDQNGTGTCPGNFMGVRITAHLTNAQGEPLPSRPSQTVYGVLQLDSRNLNDKGPAGYMLESDEAISIGANSLFNLASFTYQNFGGFYGPIHTNENFNFQWESEDTDDGLYKLTKKGQNLIDFDRLRTRPFWGLLLAEQGTQGVPTPRLRYPGDKYYYSNFGEFFNVSWLGANRPANTDVYTVTFQAQNGTYLNVNVTRGSTGDPNIDYGIPAPTVLEPVPFEMSRIVQIKKGATVYTGGVDYSWECPHVFSWGYNGEVAQEFNTNSVYNARYISHSPVFIHDKMTYSGAAPSYFYRHTHAWDSGWPLYQASHGHANVMGADLGPIGTGAYDNTSWTHTHPITNDISVNPIPATPAAVPNTFLKFNSPGFKPINTGRHELPFLRPETGPANFKNQLEQLNKYLQLTLGATLPRNPDSSLDSSVLAAAPFNVTDYSKGYILGKFPSTLPNSTPARVDFRAVYFGPHNMTYTAGADAGSLIVPDTDPYTATAGIWVNDEPGSADYMKVAKTSQGAGYRRYLFRQIPPGKVILVRDAMVLVGNYAPQGNTCTGYNAECLNFLPGFAGDPVGRATIVNGQLSIVAYTTDPPAANQDHTYNKGDILIVGNVLYHNDFFPLPADKSQMRQLSSQPTSPYTRSNVVNGPINAIADPLVEWVTETDGVRNRNTSGVPVGSLDGLGLFATHDIKISVIPLGNGYDADGPILCNGTGTADTFEDQLTIHGQLVAGNQVRVHAYLDGVAIKNLLAIDFASLCNNEPPFESRKDKLNIYGTVYSRFSPDFSSYFKIKREYFFDRSLEKNPLVGAPYYPGTAGDYRNQTLYSQFPSLVQGSWIQGAN